jgi:hypothetical protein
MPQITLTLNFIDAGNHQVNWTNPQLAVAGGLGLTGLDFANPQFITGDTDIPAPVATCSKWYALFDALSAAFEIFSDAGVTAVARSGACIGTLVIANAAALYLKPRPAPVAVGPAVLAAVAAAAVAGLGNLAAIQAYLGNQAEIRVYVPASNSRGHQTTTCLILRRLIAWGYVGAFEVIYENQNQNATTLQILLPELNLQVVGQNITPDDYRSPALGNCLFTFNVKNAAAPPATQCQFGISGGVDNPNVDPRPFCNVRYFLMLQPFQWNATNYLYAQTTTLDLGEEQLLGRLEFLGMTCYTMDPAQYTWAAASPEIVRINDAQVRLAVAGIQTVCCAPPAPTQLLMPVYGLSRGMAGVLSNWPALPQMTALANLVLAVLEGQAGAPLNLGTVLMTLDDYGPNWSTNLLELLPRNYHARISFWSPPTAWANALITGLAANEVLITNFIPDILPSPLFNYFYLNSTLPPIFEGKGTMPLMLNSGRPYLQLSKQLPGYETLFPPAGSVSPVRRLKIFLFPSIPYVLAPVPPPGAMQTTPNAEALACLDAQKGMVWNNLPNVVVNAATFGVTAVAFIRLKNYLISYNFIDAGHRVQTRFCAMQNAADFDDPFPTDIITKLQAYNNMQTACGAGAANICNRYRARLTVLSTFFATAITPATAVNGYFAALRVYFNDQANDKLIKGMGYAVSAVAQGL